MTSNKGVSLIEIIVVMIIVGILTAIAIPYYINSMYQTREQGVEHNLMAIAAAEQKYHEDHGSYYSSSNFNSINSNLSLSMSVMNDGYTYQCQSSGICYANNPSLGATVTVDTNGNLTCSPSPCP